MHRYLLGPTTGQSVPAILPSVCLAIAVPGFSHGYWDSNSDLHTCKTGTLRTELSPQTVFIGTQIVYLLLKTKYKYFSDTD